MATRAINPTDVSDIALYTEDLWQAPFAKLRAEMPVSWCPESAYGGYWSVVTHGLITEVELHPEIFSSSWVHGNITIADPASDSNLQNFIAQDPPIHTAQRKVITPAFNPSQLGKLEDQVQARTRSLLDALPTSQTFDWVENVSIPLTIGMLCILFDMPWEQRHDIKRWSDWASNVGPDTRTDAYRAAFMEQMMDMLGRFDGFMEVRRNLPPSDDLLSRMVHSEAMGNMTPIERLSNIALLIVGGNDTTRNSMSGLVEAFQKFPGELDKVRADPSLAANAAQEIIRWQSPVTHMRRTAVVDTELGGQKITKGEKVVIWYLSANRDESVFPDADRFDVTRGNARRHIAFGHGIHRCVGARLAEIQVGTLIEEIARRRIRVTPQAAPTRLASPFLHGFTAMPVQIERD
ncbi:MAG: cytochrome P450 [Sphingomonadaceae bacterium]|nr:cytochrome P450 [Sphingomonadaceae bacterium]